MTYVTGLLYPIGMEPEQMKRLRQVFGLSQERLARLIGVSVRTVARWEGGHTRPSQLASRQLRGLEDLNQLLIRLMRPDSIGDWMARPNARLKGRSPDQVLLSDGPDPIVRLLQEVAPHSM